VSTNRRKRKRVLDNSQASMATRTDSALSTNQIPVMVCKHITGALFHLHFLKILCHHKRHFKPRLLSECNILLNRIFNEEEMWGGTRFYQTGSNCILKSGCYGQNGARLNSNFCSLTLYYCIKVWCQIDSKLTKSIKSASDCASSPT